jgi:hypothetical protein
MKDRNETNTREARAGVRNTREEMQRNEYKWVTADERKQMRRRKDHKKMREYKSLEAEDRK